MIYKLISKLWKVQKNLRQLLDHDLFRMIGKRMAKKKEATSLLQLQRNVFGLPAKLWRHRLWDFFQRGSVSIAINEKNGSKIEKNLICYTISQNYLKNTIFLANFGGPANHFWAELIWSVLFFVLKYFDLEHFEHFSPRKNWAIFCSVESKFGDRSFYLRKKKLS